MWGIAVPVAWCLVLFTDVSLLYIYATIVGIDILKFLVSYYFVRKDKWVKNLTLSNE
jgi:Na+-driven multidrug efflux pump